MLCLMKIDTSDEAFTEKIKAAEKIIFNSDRILRGKMLTLYARVLLGYMLKREYGQDTFSYRYGKNGKPYLENCSAYFSISHSGDYVLCALSEKEIGCDIEKIKEYNPRIPERFFTQKEIRRLGDDNKELFTRLWTLKESILKKDGTGISGGLDSYCFADYAEKAEFFAYGCNFISFTEDGYVISVCSETESEGLVTVKKDEIAEYINNLT